MSASPTSRYIANMVEMVPLQNYQDSDPLTDEHFFVVQTAFRTLSFERKRRVISEGRYLIEGRLESAHGRTRRAMERRLKREMGEKFIRHAVLLSVPHTASEW